MTAQDGCAVPEPPMVLSLSGELDAADPAWSHELDAAIEGGSTQIVVDLLNVTFADSSVIQALVRAYRRVGDEGWVRLVYTQHVIRRVIDICGLAELLPQFTTVDAALRGAPTRFHPDDTQRRGVRSDPAETIGQGHELDPLPGGPST